MDLTIKRYKASKKHLVFEEFDKGFRPAELFSKFKLKEHTLYEYYEEWKKTLAKM